MTRLGFLLGEGIPGTAHIPMDDKNEKKVFHFPPSPLTPSLPSDSSCCHCSNSLVEEREEGCEKGIVRAKKKKNGLLQLNYFLYFCKEIRGNTWNNPWEQQG